MVVGLDSELPSHCGFCAYWHYVRAEPENRQRLRSSLRSWLDDNLHKLQWSPNPNHEASGRFELPTQDRPTKKDRPRAAAVLSHG
jgi:hypothetical protein